MICRDLKLAYVECGRGTWYDLVRGVAMMHAKALSRTSCYIPDANKVPLGFLWYFQQGMNYVDFVENASFKSSGDIY